MSDQLYCGHCGEAVDARSHDACNERLRMEPPRFCTHCHRRMQVQVIDTAGLETAVQGGSMFEDHPAAGGGLFLQHGQHG